MSPLHTTRPARGLFARAVLWSLTFGIGHVLGWREYVSVMSGTGAFGHVQRLCGVLYFVLYVGLVFAVPILLVAAGLLSSLARLGGSKGRDDVPPLQAVA